MSLMEAASWAEKLTISGVEKKICELEVWVAEVNQTVIAWGAIRGDRLEGLYTEPDFAGRGIGTGLLSLMEELMRGRVFRRCTQKQAQMPSYSTFGAVMNAADHVNQKGRSQSRSTCYSPSEVFHSAAL
jgi:GNAT superfamily N-acetyltransferase